MPGINGMGLTFNLPNFNGTIYGLTPTDTPFTSAIGVLSDGGEPVYAKDFEWQTYDLRAVENPSHLEGQDAPDARERVRTSVDNVAQVFHSQVAVSYTKMAAIAQRNGLNNAQPSATAGANEMNWQIMQELKALKRDIEHVFINGKFSKPADNTAPRKTRGLLEAITTNVVANATTAALTEKMVLDIMQQVWDNGGIQEQETATLMTNSGLKRQLSKIFITDKNYTEETRNVAGVNVQTIETDFGKLNVMLNRYMPTSELAVTSLEMCKPRILVIPGKGFLFLEPLAKTGASEKAQLYGEIGLEYGNERQHGKITNLDPNAF